MNCVRATQAYGFKTKGVRVKEDLVAKAPSMTSRAAMAFSTAADLRAAVLAILAGSTSLVGVTADYAAYYAFANHVQRLQTKFGGGTGFLDEVYQSFVTYVQRGLVYGALRSILGLFAIEIEAQPASLGTITPLNHASGVAKAGSVSCTGGTGARIYHFELVAHVAGTVILDVWTSAKSVAYTGLAGLTVYDLTITALAGGSMRTSFTDFTTIA
jgi:uncharacterized membrane protein